ncbi:MAG: hypothetical protein V3S20_07265, partial [Dehalococcoidia bacterium]
AHNRGVENPQARGPAMARQIGYFCFGLMLTALFAFAACQEGTSVFDLKVGDCVVGMGIGPEGGEFGRVRTVDCAEMHDGEVVALFDVEGDDFPGDDALLDMGTEGCPSEASTYLYPTDDSWNEMGDREITCIHESLFDLAIGDCFNFPTEDEFTVSIERRACGDSHDAQVIDLMDMPDGEFPGDEAIAEYAFFNCPEATDDYLGPTSGSWELGEDREIVCLEY